MNRRSFLKSFGVAVIAGPTCLATTEAPRHTRNFDATKPSAVNSWSAIQAAANVRGIYNPLFTGAIGVYDDVILYGPGLTRPGG